MCILDCDFRIGAVECLGLSIILMVSFNLQILSNRATDTAPREAEIIPSSAQNSCFLLLS